MKTDDFKPFDAVVDSMAAASARLGVPIETVKAAKRGGCEAFQGSRVHLGKLQEWLAAEKEPGGISGLLLAIAHDVAQRVSYALARCPGKRFREEAHRNHLKVAVHAVDKTSIQTAIDAGADSVEHGNDATDAQLKQMRDKGIFFDFTPTSYGDFFTKIFEGTIAMSLKLRPERRDSDERTRQRYNDLAQQLLKGAEVPDATDERYDRVYDSLVQRVIKSGVKFAAGSDMGWFYPGKTRGQASVSRFPTLHKAGMPSLDVIRSITTNAAEMLGWQDRIGAVEPEKFGDLIAVARDPVADITELERVRFVMKGGQVIRNDIQQEVLK